MEVHTNNGWIMWDNFEIVHSMSLGETNTQYRTKINENLNEDLIINIRSGNIHTKYSRNYTKFLNFICDYGGLQAGVYFMFLLLYSFYGQITLENELLNKVGLYERHSHKKHENPKEFYNFRQLLKFYCKKV